MSQAVSRTYTAQQGYTLDAASAEAGYRHLLSAAYCISQILEGKSIPFVFMNGYSLVLRGNQRPTRDVDIAIGCTMSQLTQVIAEGQRILRPSYPVFGVMRIFVQTGGPIDPGFPEIYVMADLIVSLGSYNAAEKALASTESITVNTELGIKDFPVLSILSILTSKLETYYARVEKNDHIDILFLVERFSESVRAIRDQLNKRHCNVFINVYRARISGDQSPISRAMDVLGVM
ncbi:hypothetical protein PAAG_11619 [Paracoccidioides lutzii Pb01]|uniref:Nucleotidyl transferase AbiEii/AbiGii toxin family protein n=1 Tax=Paracoccidioides lutzii (strain ATCC MYA-826 / Pb01) TaxID=502779 RepID=A0A0A2V1H7_PARBA|nr:hypothetical protein PAAG_11619 [Paracoccidioides lutzii Pb01]KGQ01636.1 hypothetical protein PAAG_11619 [Paracoccidioides lutzii Pb01]